MRIEPLRAGRAFPASSKCRGTVMRILFWTMEWNSGYILNGKKPFKSPPEPNLSDAGAQSFFHQDLSSNAQAPWTRDPPRKQGWNFRAGSGGCGNLIDLTRSFGTCALWSILLLRWLLRLDHPPPPKSCPILRMIWRCSMKRFDACNKG